MFPAADPSFFATPLIALVDHDPLVRLTTRRLLRTFGYRVATYSSGEEFLATDYQRVGCVILDRDLPGLDGVAVLEKLRQRGAALPALVVGAELSANQIARACAAGAVRVLSKPVEADEWLAALEDALRTHPARPSATEDESKRTSKPAL